MTAVILKAHALNRMWPGPREFDACDQAAARLKHEIGDPGQSGLDMDRVRWIADGALVRSDCHYYSTTEWDKIDEVRADVSEAILNRALRCWQEPEAVAEEDRTIAEITSDIQARMSEQLVTGGP